jgi:hypothetical protein
MRPFEPVGDRRDVIDTDSATIRVRDAAASFPDVRVVERPQHLRAEPCR